MSDLGGYGRREATAKSHGGEDRAGAVREIRQFMKCAMAELVVLITFAGVAAAQPVAVPAKLPSVPAAQPAPEGSLSEGLAFGLSFGATVASWTVLGAGISMEQHNSQGARYVFGIGALSTTFAPTIGHWYARRGATRGLGLRLAGAVAVAIGFRLAVACEEDCPAGYSAAFALLLFGGAGLHIAGTIDDVATAPRAARRYNARHERIVVPVVNPAMGSFGLAFSGRF
jgi:hypothetical protein